MKVFAQEKGRDALYEFWQANSFDIESSHELLNVGPRWKKVLVYAVFRRSILAKIDSIEKTHAGYQVSYHDSKATSVGKLPFRMHPGSRSLKISLRFASRLSLICSRRFSREC